MKLIPSILRISRLVTAVALVTAPTGPVYAAAGASPSPSYKDAAAGRPDGVKTVKDARTRSASPLRSLGDLKIPMYFEANRGQTDASVKFFTRAAGYRLYLTDSEAVTVLPRAEADKVKEPIVVRMKLKGANVKHSVQGVDILPGRTSYFLGSDSSKWQVGVEQYAKVKLGQVYPGIDMVYRFGQGQVEYDFVVAPGANPGRILMGFEGAKSLKLDLQGNLVLGVDGGELTYKAPKLYQQLGSRRVRVTGRFVLAANKSARFEVGNYIRTKELVIDPQIAYGTYLGGSVDDAITAIKVDGARQAYVTGWANSAQSGAGGFPAATKTYPLTALTGTIGGKDVFVAKMSEDGATLLWLAWLGGTLADQANGLALDNSSLDKPNVYITGETASAGAGTAFPVYGPAMQVCTTNTGSLAFVAELSQAGTPAIPSLVYSTCWGGVSGTLTNTGNGIAVDATGAAYVTGTTEVSGFPVVGTAAAPYNALGGAQDGFIFKVKPAGIGGVQYSMFLGPTSGTTFSNAVAVDALGKAWVTGRTTSDTWPAAPRAGHFSAVRTAGVNPDGFVAQVNAAGDGLDYMTYINGNVSEEGTAITLNNNGAAPYNIFVAGWTDSGTDFPSTAYLLEPVGTRPLVYQKPLQGAADAFVLRLNPAEASADRSLEMVYATHVGAAGGAERATSLALDSRDDAYIAGWTRSSNWPVAGNDTLTAGALGTNVTGKVETNTSTDEAAFVAAVDLAGLTRPFFSYLGSTPGTYDLQRANGIAIDNLHNIYVAGITPSNFFPLTTGSLMDGSVAAKQLNGTGTQNATDGFIVKIAPVVVFGGPLDISSPTISIDLPVNGSIMNYTSTGVVVNYFDAGGISTSTLIVKFDGVALSTLASTVVFSSGTAGIVTVYDSSATFTLTALSQSTHTLDASVQDLAGNLSTATQAGFMVDLTSPTISVAQPPDNGFLNATSTMVVVNYADTGGSGISTSTLVIKLDAVALSTSTFTQYAASATVSITGLSVGAHTLDASVSDYAINFTSATQSGFTVTLTSPTITTGYPLDGSFVTYASTVATINYADSGGSGLNLASLVVKLDGVAVSAGAITAGATQAAVNLTLSVGVHTLDATIANNLGNTTIAPQVSFTVLAVVACGDDFFYPSPATGATGTFAYCMPLPGTIKIRVYNTVGDLAVKVEESKAAGPQISPIDTGKLATGIYLYRLEKDFGGGNSTTSKVKKFSVRH